MSCFLDTICWLTLLLRRSDTDPGITVTGLVMGMGTGAGTDAMDIGELTGMEIGGVAMIIIMDIMTGITEIPIMGKGGMAVTGMLCPTITGTVIQARPIASTR